MERTDRDTYAWFLSALATRYEVTSVLFSIQNDKQNRPDLVKPNGRYMGYLTGYSNKQQLAFPVHIVNARLPKPVATNLFMFHLLSP